MLLLLVLTAFCRQEYLQLEKQYKQQQQQLRSGYYDSYDGPWGSRPPRPKPLFRLLQEALLSQKDLEMIHTERLQYTQLLYRWVDLVHKLGGCWLEMLPPYRRI